MTDDLDRLIDDVAREMTDRPASASLRPRVMSELDRGARLQPGRDDQAKAWSYRRYRRHLGWLAAAAGILLAAYLAWPARAPVQMPAASPSVATRAPVTGARPPARIERATVTPRAPQRPGEPTQIAELPAPLAALPEPAAIAIAPIDERTTDITELQVEPLEIADLEIRPLTPPQ